MKCLANFTSHDSLSRLIAMINVGQMSFSSAAVGRVYNNSDFGKLGRVERNTPKTCISAMLRLLEDESEGNKAK